MLSSPLRDERQHFFQVFQLHTHFIRQVIEHRAHLASGFRVRPLHHPGERRELEFRSLGPHDMRVRPHDPGQGDLDGGWLLRINLPKIAVGSMATVGGPGSTLALAMAMKWNDLVTPGVIMGFFGWAVGNYFGFACAYLVRLWQ